MTRFLPLMLVSWVLCLGCLEPVEDTGWEEVGGAFDGGGVGTSTGDGGALPGHDGGTVVLPRDGGVERDGGGERDGGAERDGGVERDAGIPPDGCPVPAVPTCRPGECLLPGTVDPSSGCVGALRCGACCSNCATTYAPVCTAQYATFTNACLARCAGSGVPLHQGACLPGEGLACNPLGSASQCGSTGQLYCRPRNGNPGVSGACTQVGACIADMDCLAPGQPRLSCPNGANPRVSCTNERVCEPRC